MLKSCIQMIQTNALNKSRWKGLTYDLSEKNLDYLDYERELMRELERGEMKLSSVVIYYRMAQYMDGINEALRNILSELTEEPLIQKSMGV
jgi:hypothetical protein